MSTSDAVIRVFLVVTAGLERAALRVLMDSWPRVTVVGEADADSDAAASISSKKPDIVVVDLDDSFPELIPEILAADDTVRAVVLTGSRDAALHQRAVRLGTLGIVLKEKGPDELRRAIEKVYAGEVWLDRSLTASVISDFRGLREHDGGVTPPLDVLSARERELAHLVAEGLKNRSIGQRLFISETTVRHHLTSIFSKIGVSNRVELVLLLQKSEPAPRGRLGSIEAKK
jgi:DNA-binding NarL/FixJ family response regulator